MIAQLLETQHRSNFDCDPVRCKPLLAPDGVWPYPHSGTLPLDLFGADEMPVSLGARDRISPAFFGASMGVVIHAYRKSALIQVRNISYRFLEKRAPLGLRLLRHRGGTFDPTSPAHAFHQWGSLALIRVFRCFGPYFWRQVVRNDLLCRMRNCYWFRLTH